MRNFLARLATALPSLGCLVVLGADPPPDKSNFTLFNPVPVSSLREMNTDRPDKTESPFTVDAGHFQIELDLATYSYDRHNAARDGTLVRAWSVAPMNLKIGLLNQLDVQFVLQPYLYVHTSDPVAGVARQRGFGDITTRVKWNLWGNDGGTTALALMPYVKLPTNQDGLGNHSVEGGLIVPLAVELPAGWGLGLMTQFDVVRDGASRGYHPEFVNSITFSHDLVGNLGGYAEFFSSVNPERGADWVGTVDVGLTYALTKNLQLDAGINLGVTRAADDWSPFIGLSWRF